MRRESKVLRETRRQVRKLLAITGDLRERLAVAERVAYERERERDTARENAQRHAALYANATEKHEALKRVVLNMAERLHG